MPLQLWQISHNDRTCTYLTSADWVCKVHIVMSASCILPMMESLCNEDDVDQKRSSPLCEEIASEDVCILSYYEAPPGGFQHDEWGAKESASLSR